MVNDILIGSFYRDAPWLKYCLRSIRKFCKGFRQVIVVIPDGERPAFSECDFTGCRVVERKGWMSTRPEMDDQPGHGIGYFQHVWDNMNADGYSDAEFITHMDSDCIFTRETTPEHYFEDGKPLLWYRRYVPEEAEGGMCWQPRAEAMLGYPLPYETMVVFPITYPREVYLSCRQWVEWHHKKSLELYLLDLYRSTNAARDVTDFNVLGAHALRFLLHRFTAKHAPRGMPERYYSNRIHNWSFGGITPEIQENLESILK